MIKDYTADFRKIVQGFVFFDGCPEVSKKPANDILSDASRLLESFLLLVKSDVGQLTATASASVLHRNGFIKIPMFEDPVSGREVRFHSWNGSYVGEENIHSHTKPYWSFVVAGSVLVERYELGPGNSYNAYRSSHIGRSDYALEVLDRLSLEHVGTDIITRGECHFGDTKTLHRLIVSQGQSASTIFCQGPRELSESRIFSEVSLCEARQRHFSLSKHQVIECLEKEIEQIKS